VDLLFTDIVMPGQMNGRELADKVTARYPITRVLFTLGYTDKADAEQSPLPAGSHFLSKPYYRQDLARRVREVLDLEVCYDR
jgi:CheY-like chemotaxis protein